MTNFIEVKTKRYPNEPILLNVDRILWIHQFNAAEHPDVTRVYLGNQEFVDLPMNYDDAVAYLGFTNSLNPTYHK